MSSETVANPIRAKVELELFKQSQHLQLRWSWGDDTRDTFFLAFGIPWLLSFAILLSYTPGALTRWFCKGPGERVFYGFLLDDYAISAQWGKILDIPGKGGGWEFRRVWNDVAGAVTQSEEIVEDWTLGGSLPATEHVAFQHLHFTVTKTLVVRKWNAWWKPSLHRHYYSVELAGAVKNAWGEVVGEFERQHFARVGSELEAVREYVLDLMNKLGFDTQHA